MSDIKLLIEKLNKGVKLPERAHTTDSGFDLYAENITRIYVHGGGNGEAMLSGEQLKRRIDGTELTLSYLERALIGTGIKATVGTGYEIQIRPRSGLAVKEGLTVLNTPGTIDEGYRDEIGVIIVNLSRADKTIKRGDRIAQLVVTPVILPEIEVVNTLPAPNSKRDGGFGSTGS